jgi:hypothetical protein
MRQDTQHLTKEQLKRLRLPVGVEDTRLALQVAVECAFHVSQPLIGKEAPDSQQCDAHHLIQMVLLRSASVLHLSEGTPHPSGANVHLPWPTALDPVSIWGLVRAQYEAFAALSNIFTQHQGVERDFLYSIWALAGLMNRAPIQEFLEDPQYAKYVQREDKEAYQRLLAEIEVEKAKFQALPLFKTQTPKKQGELMYRIARGQFQFVIEGGVPIWKGWHVTFMRAAKSDLFDTLYASMSLWVHPSNAAARRFGVLFGPERDHLRQLEHALSLAALILAMTMHEQIALFSECRSAYDALPSERRELLEHWNSMCRAEHVYGNQAPAGSDG